MGANGCLSYCGPNKVATSRVSPCLHTMIAALEPGEPQASCPPVLTAGPPSAPVNAVSSVNGTSVNLEWDRPMDTGGRSDLLYSVLCQKCSGEGGPCESCDSQPGAAAIGGKAGTSIGAGGLVERSGTAAVRFIPRQNGLTERWVTVINLVAHTNYSFRVLAMNAVSHLSNKPPPFAVVNITTNQAGRVRNLSEWLFVWVWSPQQHSGDRLGFLAKKVDK